MKAASQKGKQPQAAPAKPASSIGEANGDTGVSHAPSMRPFSLQNSMACDSCSIVLT